MITVVAFCFGFEAIITGTRVWKVAEVPPEAPGEDSGIAQPQRGVAEDAFGAAQSPALSEQSLIEHSLSEHFRRNQRQAILQADQDL